MKSGNRASILCLGLAVVGLACLYPLQKAMNATFTSDRTIEDTLYISSGETVRRLSVGFDGVIADLYWIRAVQYFGLKFGGGLENKPSYRESRGKADIPQLAPLLDIITTIDPDYLAAYRSGSSFLAEYDFDSAASLLKKGIAQARDPLTRFKLWADLGSIYWRAKRYDECAQAYDEASKSALSPRDRAWTALMVGAAKTKGGDRKTSYLLFTRLFEDAEDDTTRNAAIWRLEQLQSLDEREFLMRMVVEFQKRTGQKPHTLAQLLPLIMQNRETAKDALGRPLKMVLSPGEHFTSTGDPLDPSGMAYRYDPERNCIGLTEKSKIAREIDEICR